MSRNTTCRALAVITTEPAPDSIVVQAAIDRRLALRLGVSLPVAATLAALAGIGPQTREARA